MMWAKIAGGAAVGMGILGPLGAFIGAVGGYAVDRLMQPADKAVDTATDKAATPPPTTPESERAAYSAAIVVLAAKLSKADGMATEDELAAFERAFEIPPEEQADVRRLFDAARRDALGYEPYARQVAQLFADRPEVREELLNALITIAWADGEVHENERRFLDDVAAILGIPASTVDRLMAGNDAGPPASPYAVLGVTPEASDEAVRTAWLELVQRYHPDRLVGQGMAQEQVGLCQRQLAAINAAYDRIRQERGSVPSV